MQAISNFADKVSHMVTNATSSTSATNIPDVDTNGNLKALSDRKWRWGLMGSGKICEDFAHALRDCVPDAIIQAVGARDIEDAKKFQAKYPCTPYGSYEELARDPNVDIVYVGTVHSKHHEQALLAIRAGKPVLVEKAFTQNSKQAEAVVNLAKEKGVFLMEAYWARFMPWCYKLREILAAGTIGDVHHVLVDFALQFDKKEAKRIFDPETAGGALLDVGIYPISIISMIYGGGTPERIVAIGDKLDTGVDGHIAITLKYGKNKLAQAFTSAIVNSPRTLHVLGSKGRIEVHDPSVDVGFWHAATQLTLKVQTEDGKGTKDTTFHFKKPSSNGKFNFGNSEMLSYEAQECQRRLLAKATESPILTPTESLTIMRTLDEIRSQLGVVYPNESAK